MTCINDHNIQAYIDHEVTDTERRNIEQHLEACPKCKGRVADISRRSLLLKDAIKSTEKPIEIREFSIPKRPVHSKRKTVRRLMYISSIVAASLLSIVFLTRKEANTTAPEMSYLVFDVEADFNANLPLSEQNFAIHIIDSEGKQIDL